MNAWWHLAEAFKLQRGPRLRARRQGTTAGGAQNDRLGGEQRECGRRRARRARTDDLLSQVVGAARARCLSHPAGSGQREASARRDGVRGGREAREGVRARRGQRGRARNRLNGQARPRTPPDSTLAQSSLAHQATYALTRFTQSRSGRGRGGGRVWKSWLPRTTHRHTTDRPHQDTTD